MAKILGTEHPSENQVLFRLSAALPPESCRTYDNPAEALENGLARALFLIMGVQEVRIATDHVILTRTPETIWPLIIPPAINIISSRVKQFKTEVA